MASRQHRQLIASVLVVMAGACHAGPDARQDQTRAGRVRRRRGRPRATAGQRRQRSDRVVGRRTGRHRLGGGDRDKRDRRHRGVPERQRSRPRREVRLPQRAEPSPGVELVPRQPGRIQRRAVRAVQDAFSISIPITRIRRCAPSPESGSARRSCRRWPADRPRWTLDHIGIGPDPVRLRRRRRSSRRERQSPLPFGFAFENPRTFEPLSGGRDVRPYDARLLARRVFQNTSLLIAKLRHGRQGGELGTRSAGLRQPRARWIACSSRARPATSAASMVSGR